MLWNIFSNGGVWKHIAHGSDSIPPMILIGKRVVISFLHFCRGAPFHFWKLPAIRSLSPEVCVEVAIRIATHTNQSICLVSISARGRAAEGLLLYRGVRWRLQFMVCRLASLLGLGQAHVTSISRDILPRLIYSWAEYIIQKSLFILCIIWKIPGRE